jgi:hypothetical protein
MLALFAQTAPPALSGENLPAFVDFPAQKSFAGIPAMPILRTVGQRLFRTQIREAARKGPNFAGHYTNGGT